MKKLLLFAVLISGFVFGQFKITDSSDNWEKVGNVQQFIFLYQKQDKSKAKIEYRDYTTISTNPFGLDLSYYTFEFSTEPDTLDKIYQIIKDHFESKKQETMTLTFPEGNMTINFASGFGGYSCAFKFDKANKNLEGDRSQRSTGGFTMKQANKLFWKK